MKTRLLRFIGLMALMALLCGAPPAAAYWPPCQDVTGPTLSADGTKVEFSVVNPATGQTVLGAWYIPSGFSMDQPNQNQGIVAWRFYNSSLQYYICFGTYDPVRGWQTVSVAFQSHTPSIHSIQDGVVWVEQTYTSGDTQYASQRWFTYDPEVGPWWPNLGLSVNAPLVNGGAVKGYYSKNGVVAVHHNFTDSGGDTLRYQVYDPTRKWWRNVDVGGTAGDVIQSVSIDDYGAIHYTLNGTGYVKGYSVTNGVWQDKVGYYAAELYAAFVAQPVSGNAPLTVWVTDMSLGAWAGGIGVSFAYNWGDGASSTNLRSGFHTYTGFNKYTLSHTVTRGKTVTYASDTRTTQIITYSTAFLPSVELLLLGD